MKKIALEEHFTTPDMSAYAHGPGSSMNRQRFGQFEQRLLDFGEMRLEAMDEADIDLAVLSVTSPGVQAAPKMPTTASPAWSPHILRVTPASPICPCRTPTLRRGN